MNKLSAILMGICAAGMVSACSMDGEYLVDGDYMKDGGYMAEDAAFGGEGGEGGSAEPGSEPGGNNSQAGRVTAGEWNDLENWAFWGGLMTDESYSGMSGYWCFWTNNRIAFVVTDKEDNPISGVKISLERSKSEIWSSVTDNMGHAECWVGMFQKEDAADASAITVKVNGKTWAGAPAITSWDCPNGVAVNKIVLENATQSAQKADIAFIVDATGSMSDEIQFLKDDLMDILKKVEAAQGGVSFRTAALFYRDEGDDYITRTSNFSDKFSTTLSFIGKQEADGGGDYPEAVHTALETGLQGLSWDSSAKTRLAFMLLDAPAHHNDAVIASLQKSVAKYAANGIKIIPIAASGIDKNAEFMLRFFAVATGGTYVFITNDSGIGGDHIAASVGEYKVELLNDLIIRLIEKYTD